MAVVPNKAITNTTLVKETPVVATFVAADSTGYKTNTDISFAFVDGACTITGTGFTAAGLATAVDGQRLLVSSTSGLNDGLYTIVDSNPTDTVITLAAGEVLTTETAAAAGTVVLYTVAVYKIKPTKATAKLLIKIFEGGGEAGMIVSFISGSYWVAQNTELTTLATTVTESVDNYLFIETAPYMCADGYIYMVLRPVATDTLLAGHAPTVGFIELP